MRRRSDGWTMSPNVVELKLKFLVAHGEGTITVTETKMAGSSCLPLPVVATCGFRLSVDSDGRKRWLWLSAVSEARSYSHGSTQYTFSSSSYRQRLTLNFSEFEKTFYRFITSTELFLETEVVLSQELFSVSYWSTRCIIMMSSFMSPWRRSIGGDKCCFGAVSFWVQGFWRCIDVILTLIVTVTLFARLIIPTWMWLEYFCINNEFLWPQILGDVELSVTYGEACVFFAQ